MSNTSKNIPSEQVDQVLSIAAAEVGTVEKPTNKTKYGKWYGMDGQPWCAMFVSWCFNQAGLTKLIKQSPKGFAGVEAFEAWARTKKLVIPGNSMVRSGDIVLFDFTKSGKSQHVGIALGGQDPHTHLVPTIEGNTSPSSKGSQANGEGVYEKYRALSTIRCVVRPKYEG